MPGDPLLHLLGEELYYSVPDLVEELKAKYGLNKPLYEQYLIYLVNLLHFNWGCSFHYMQPVFDIIVLRLKWTLFLLVPSVLLGSAIGMFLGLIARWKSGSKLDIESALTLLFVYSMPHYWLAMLSLLIFAFHLKLFPLGGVYHSGLEGFSKLADILWHMCLPLAVLSFFNTSYKYLIVRNSVIHVLEEEFILTAMAKGLDDQTILFKHVLRIASLPLLTIVTLDFGFMVSGTLLVEVVFSWPGMGALIYDAITAKDYPVLQGCFLLVTLCVLVANFLADICYTILDPRVRME
ncbi:MAG: ABC transporter permease [Thermoprotei archaeon]|nr:MAG: ABC transporter permease [Thermoprotei archaeon]